ncbi:metalloregulator ArsR/SmtB family transcription factor [Altererythrobacter salegens]|uniref:Metalloregulator ArsR/SmtB family transcription factor n=1 Tax=Croceibacterium salegens TaxID=1737568 RepID=A0A6I4SVR1_9SPHN|nr:metalloregulator ArsR/SmtB family transcription factor [Croceibacterium salegens]MXO59973.1 metalloregulator ArsR/SmtB family transcription factor [Croceibacterium salegens]
MNSNVSPVELDTLEAVSESEIEVLRESAHRASTLLKQLANEQRLLIMCKLMEGECSVSYLAEHIGLAQSATSQHLAKLRETGLLATRRDAQSIYYRIGDENAVRVLKTLCEIFAPPGH